MQEVVEKFVELAKIPSPSGKEERVREKILELYSELGKWEIDKIGNMYLSIGEGEKALFLNAHIDTVPVEKDEIKVIIEDGVIKTDGTTILGADDKSGVVAILEAVKRKRGSFTGRIDIVLTVGEEVGLNGAKSIEIERIKAKEGYVLDSHGRPGYVISSSPFHNTLKFFVYGRSAHAGVEPEKGINAIQLASKAISKLNLGKIDFETTANIGFIKGGSATNVIPDYTEIWGEARSREEEKLIKITDEMIETFIKEVESGEGRIEYKLNREYNGYKLDENDRLIEIIKRVSKKLSLEFTLEPSMGGSDANIFYTKGIKCAVLGTGMTNVHTPNETILVEDLINSEKMVEEIIVEYFKE